MAITYHAGRRIQGLEYTASTLTTSGFAQTWGKDPSNSQFEVSGGKINFLDNTSSSGDRTWLDLQSIIGSAVSTTKWILRFKFNFSTLTSGSYYYEFDAGLSDTTVNNMTNQNFIGVRVLPSGFNNLWRPRTTDGTSYPRGGSSADISQSYSTGTDYYVEIKRTSASNWSISLSTTNAYDGDIQDDSYTDAGSATGLRYFKFGDAVTNTGTGFTMQGVCDVLEFYNDTNTIATASGDEKPTNVQLGSRFEETDTRKMYYYAEQSQNFASVLSTYTPQFFLKLDEGSGTALTNSGSNSGYTASVTVNSSNPVWDAGVDGANKALKFNGSNNGLGYIGHTSLPTESTGDNFTMGLTFKISTDFTGGDSNHHHLWKWNNNGLGFWQMNMTNDGYIGTAYFNGGWQHLVGTTDSSDNAWHTFFLTCTSGSAVKGYLDGTQEFSGTANRSGYAGNDADWISHNGGNGVISYDNVFFKNTVMTASEISSLHTLLVPPTTNEWKELGT